MARSHRAGPLAGRGCRRPPLAPCRRADPDCRGVTLSDKHRLYGKALCEPLSLNPRAVQVSRPRRPMAPHGCERFEFLCQALGLSEPDGRLQLSAAPRSYEARLAPTGGVRKLRPGPRAQTATMATTASASAATHASLGVCSPGSGVHVLQPRHCNAQEQPRQQPSLQQPPCARQARQRRQQQVARASLSGSSVTTASSGAADCG